MWQQDVDNERKCPQKIPLYVLTVAKHVFLATVDSPLQFLAPHRLTLFKKKGLVSGMHQSFQSFIDLSKS